MMMFCYLPFRDKAALTWSYKMGHEIFESVGKGLRDYLVADIRKADRMELANLLGMIDFRD